MWAGRYVWSSQHRDISVTTTHRSAGSALKQTRPFLRHFTAEVDRNLVHWTRCGHLPLSVSRVTASSARVMGVICVWGVRDMQHNTYPMSAIQALLTHTKHDKGCSGN